MSGTLSGQGAAALVQRSCTVQVADLLIEAGNGTGLDVAFTVRRGLHVTQGSLKPQPNTCDLKIWNLNPTHRKELASSTIPTPGGKPKIIPCVLSGGYVGRSSMIFSGELRAANIATEGPDKVTELTTGDGDTALTQARLNVALAAGSSAEQALQAILSALGVSAGNLAKAQAMLQASPAAGQLFAKGAVLKGAAAEIMSDFCRSVGLEWSIQNGALQLLELGKPSDGLAILMSPTSGLIGSPTVDTRGILSFVCEMIPDIKPGVKVAMQSESVTGGFRVIGCEYSGDTMGNDWLVRCEAQRY